jgi:hypothetical protein
MICLILQVSLWTMQQKKTDSTKEFRLDFERTFYEAVHTVAPAEEATLEMPDSILVIDDQEVTAYTYYDTERGFVTKVNWRRLLGLEPEMRRHIAYHEACHLLDGRRLKERRQLEGNERMAMEMRAERCSMPYWHSDSESPAAGR